MKAGDPVSNQNRGRKKHKCRFDDHARAGNGADRNRTSPCHRRGCLNAPVRRGAIWSPTGGEQAPAIAAVRLRVLCSDRAPALSNEQHPTNADHHPEDKEDSAYRESHDCQLTIVHEAGNSESHSAEDQSKTARDHRAEFKQSQGCTSSVICHSMSLQTD